MGLGKVESIDKVAILSHNHHLRVAVINIYSDICPNYCKGQSNPCASDICWKIPSFRRALFVYVIRWGVQMRHAFF